MDRTLHDRIILPWGPDLKTFNKKSKNPFNAALLLCSISFNMHHICCSFQLRGRKIAHISMKKEETGRVV